MRYAVVGKSGIPLLKRTMKTDALLVPKDEIDTVWNMVSGFIDTALGHSQKELDTESVHRLLIADAMQLWIVVEKGGMVVAAMTTEILNYPLKRVCRIVTLGGVDFDQWKHHISLLESWAREVDCDSMDMMCRKGFERTIADLGYDKHYIHMGKEL